MNFKTIRWEDDAIILLDQTCLPEKLVERVCTTKEELHEAIRILATRGAPLLGITAAYGVCLGMKNFAARSTDEYCAEVKRVAEYIKSSRPTAVNLFWALDRMVQKATLHKDTSVENLKKILFEEACAIHAEDEGLCRAIGESGDSLIDDGDVVLTHCNAGALATGGIGTALAPLYVAAEKGKKIKVYADETRPLLQGSRLTCWELSQNGIDVTGICDNMAASLMRKGVIKKVITGADRIAANGDAANKIGTYGVAVCAKYHSIPFYIAAPYSTFDFACKRGADIPIEERDQDELKYVGKKQIAPLCVTTYNPAFDVTPHELIAGFITERGIIKPPFIQNLKVLR
jgi:methylthioribose-1-phosphate isomerase